MNAVRAGLSTAQDTVVVSVRGELLWDAADQLRRDATAIEDVVDYGDERGLSDAVLYLRDSAESAMRTVRQLGNTVPLRQSAGGWADTARQWAPSVAKWSAIAYALYHTAFMGGPALDHMAWSLAVIVPHVVRRLARTN